MGSLFSGLHIVANTLTAYQRALDVTNNNVSNANTPGYAKQTAQLAALDFDSSTAGGGGSHFAGTVDSRDEFAESNVWQAVSSESEAQQRASGYAGIEAIFPVDGASGISAALNGFFQTISNLTTTPNDTTARNLALTSASAAAQAFQSAIGRLDQLSSQARQFQHDSVDQFNQLAQQVANLNHQVMQNIGAAADPGVSARISDTLEQLAQYGNLNVMRMDDGTVSVYVGQSQVVDQDRLMALQWVSGPGGQVLQDSQGGDVASSLTAGSLHASMQQLQQALPTLEDNLNQLAASFAAQVNSALNGGVDQNAQGPGKDLFAYDPVAGAARTIAVGAGLQAADLALADPSAPGGAAVARKVAAIATDATVAGLGGATLTQFYAALASQAGHLSANAQADQATAQSITAQARSMRESAQGVSLDEEAVHMIEFQRGYDATSKLVTAINEMLQTLLSSLS